MTLLPTVLALGLTVSTGQPAAPETCDKDHAAATADKGEGFKLIHVDDLQKLQADAAHPVHLFDANDDSFRKKEGVIPGAVLLTSFKDYDVASTLPSDKASAVVFYCGNTKCMASHAAAKKATSAGYANVSVMADGLLGWKQAGKPVLAVH